MVERGEGVGGFARGFFVLEHGVDGEAEGDDFDGQQAGSEPRRVYRERWTASMGMMEYLPHCRDPVFVDGCKFVTVYCRKP